MWVECRVQRALANGGSDDNGIAMAMLMFGLDAGMMGLVRCWDDGADA